MGVKVDILAIEKFPVKKKVDISLEITFDNDLLRDDYSHDIHHEITKIKVK